MHNFLEKLQPKHLIHSGIIYIPHIHNVNEYYILQQNQNYFNETHWKKFRDQYSLKIKLLDLKNINKSNPICLWFFKEKPDYTEYKKYCEHNNLPPYRNFADITINNHSIQYQPNTVLITNREIKLNKNNFVLRRPCVQIDYKSLPIAIKKTIKKLLVKELD